METPRGGDRGKHTADADQVEIFDMFLRDGDDGSLELAQLLDDVNSTGRDTQNAYYLYTYEPGMIAAGSWFPSFVSTSGSIEFLARFSAVSRDVPEPTSVFLLGAGLFVLGVVKQRHGRRSRIRAT